MSTLGIRTAARGWAEGMPALLALPAAVLGVVLVAVAVREYDAPLVMVMLLSGLAGLAMLAWPAASTGLVAFGIYLNAPAVAVRNGVPGAIAGSLVLMLCAPLAYQLFVRGERLRVDRTLGLMCLWVAALSLSSLGAVDVNVAADRVVGFVTSGMLLYWLFFNVIRSMAALRLVIWAVLAAGSVLGGLSLYQSVTGNYTQDFGGFAARQLEYEFKRAEVSDEEAAGRMFRSDRAEGPGLGPNRYAQVMILLLPLAMFSFRQGRSQAERIGAAVAGGLILAGVLLTYSRSNMMVVAFLLVAACWAKWVRPAHLVALGLCGMLAAPVVAPALVDRLASIATVSALGDDNPTDGAHSTIAGRATEMMAAFYVFRDHPLLGVGPGQYGPFYSLQYQQIPEIQFRDIAGTRRAHSLYPELAAETGIVGLVVFLSIPAVLFVTFNRIRRSRATRPESADLATAFMLSLLGYYGTALFLHLSYERYYWLIMVLAGCALDLIRRQQAAADASAGSAAMAVPARDGRRQRAGIGA